MGSGLPNYNQMSSDSLLFAAKNQNKHRNFAANRLYISTDRRFKPVQKWFTDRALPQCSSPGRGLASLAPSAQDVFLCPTKKQLQNEATQHYLVEETLKCFIKLDILTPCYYLCTPIEKLSCRNTSLFLPNPQELALQANLPCKRDWFIVSVFTKTSKKHLL
ncbi:MAG: hypothetical protein EAY75_01905 [Bacteroidetes bacterium]|nr:MAG: hypothetical protein EAY75_01905 [Bacteroidota bacterium]